MYNFPQIPGFRTPGTHSRCLIVNAEAGRVGTGLTCSSSGLKTDKSSGKLQACYPLVMTNIAMENHHVLWENPL